MRPFAHLSKAGKNRYMHWIDLSIFILYMTAMLAIGWYFLRRNKNVEDYYVGGRGLSRWHVGLSVVATDVGGGFSIGLGGLGFTMGLSGSWMLFTGLIGAWITGAILIPRIHSLGKKHNLFTFPQIFQHAYGSKVALLAGVISLVGYTGFTASQLLAGAKLASGSFATLDLHTALYIMGAIVIVYTVFGGLKAVIYTDTVQWIILLVGLTFVGLPLAYNAVGGWESIRHVLEPEMLRLDNISWWQFVNWGLTILPIWFVGMTLYQRIYSCKSEREAKKAWYIAGVFEWPIMAFLGVALGLLGRMAFEQGFFAEMGYTSFADFDPEMGIPLMLRNIMPVGLLGLIMTTYFSAIMSTADSCLMAASGNLVTDIIERFKRLSHSKMLRISQYTTLLIGLISIVIASQISAVLDIMLSSYAIMVSGLFIPVLGAVFWKSRNETAALAAMIGGGGTTVIWNAVRPSANDYPAWLGGMAKLDPIFYGLLVSGLMFFLFHRIQPKRRIMSSHQSIKNE